MAHLHHRRHWRAWAMCCALGLCASAADAQVTDLAATVAGDSVTLTWSGTAADWQIEAGPAPGTTTVAIATGSATPGYSVTPVASGTYFVRVRPLLGGVAGAASNEIEVAVVPVLTSQVSGSTVVLSWSGVAANWLVEAGSAPGLADLAVFATGLVGAYVASGVPAGTYYVRVRAYVGGVAGPPSNEVLVQVSGCVPTLRRIDLRSQVSFNQVALGWSYFGTFPQSWLLEAGPAPGATDTVLQLPFTQSQFVAVVATGNYYVRLRRSEGCDPPSNEVLVQPGVSGAIQCIVAVPLAGIVAVPGITARYTVSINSGCEWVAEPQEWWISLVTSQGVGGQQLSFTVSPFAGASGQIPIRTRSGRYLLQVWQ